jgi:UDP-N-acetylmuramoylalanine--D-glutamate ligase
MMEALSFLDGQTVAVMGLGKSGTATLRALAKAGVAALAWDDSPEARNQAMHDGFMLGDLTEADWSKIDLVVWSPGIPHVHPAPHPVAVAARRAQVPLVCDVELLCRANLAARYVGITGTNGKSTTTTLIGHVLAAAGAPLAVGGNLGTPALDLPSLGLDGTYVLELSSYQLELLDQARFDVAVLLNITPDHLARHGGMEGYIEAKSSLFAKLRGDGVAVLGIDDAPSRQIFEALTQRSGLTLLPISAERFIEGGISAVDGVLVDDSAGRAEKIVDLGRIASLPGRHNWQNACAAFAVAKSCGMAREEIAAQLESYPGLHHRQELVAIIDGVRYVNDSKATNADAAEKAMVCYDNIYWIAGGQAKEGGIESLAPLFSRVRRAFLIGEAAPAFAKTLEGKVAVELCGTLEAAVGKARDAAIEDNIPGAVVLLSPACASWDQFKSFEHRGEMFRQAVDALAGARSAA